MKSLLYRIVFVFSLMVPTTVGASWILPPGYMNLGATPLYTGQMQYPQHPTPMQAVMVSNAIRNNGSMPMGYSQTTPMGMQLFQNKAMHGAYIESLQQQRSMENMMRAYSIGLQ